MDNWDHEEDTQSGIGSSHDTVLILKQEKTKEIERKANISDTAVIHVSKQSKDELPCQKRR